MSYGAHIQPRPALDLLPKLKTLVIDRDNLSQRNLSRMLLDLRVQQVTIASSLEEAIKITSEEFFDLYLSDDDFDGNHAGFHLFQELRLSNRIPHSAIYIVITSNSSQDYVTSFVELAPDGFLIKPFSLEQMKTRLVRSISRKRVLLGDVYKAMDENRNDQALAACERVLKSLPKPDPEVLRLKGDLLDMLCQFGEAEALYRSILKTKQLPWAEYGLARTLYAQGSLSESVKIAVKLLQEHPQFLRSYDFLSSLLHEQGHAARAQSILQQAADASPLNTQRQEKVAEIASVNGDFEVAAKAFARVLEHRKGTPFSKVSDYTNLARAYLEQQDVIRVREVVLNLREDMPQNLGAKLSSSVLQARCANLDQDLEEFQSALSEACALYTAEPESNQIVQGDSQLACDFADVCLEGGKQDIAENILENALSAHPNSSGPLADIRHVFMRHGQSKSLQTHLDHLSKKLVDMNNEAIELALDGNLAASAEQLSALAGKTSYPLFQINASKAIFTLLHEEGWNASHANEGLRHLKRAKEKDPENEQLSTAEALYIQCAKKYGQTVERI